MNLTRTSGTALIICILTLFTGEIAMSATGKTPANLYGIEVESINGKKQKLEEFKGKVLLKIGRAHV